MNEFAVLRQPQLPPQPRIALRQVMLERRPAWAWHVRSTDGRLVGFGIKSTRTAAVDSALEHFPRARPPVLERVR